MEGGGDAKEEAVDDGTGQGGEQNVEHDGQSEHPEVEGVALLVGLDPLREEELQVPLRHPGSRRQQ